MVVISYARIERNPCTYDFFLPSFLQGEYVITYVAEYNSYCLTFKFGDGSANIFERSVCKFFKMGVAARLRGSYSYDVVFSGSVSHLEKVK